MTARVGRYRLTRQLRLCSSWPMTVARIIVALFAFALIASVLVLRWAGLNQR